AAWRCTCRRRSGSTATTSCRSSGVTGSSAGSTSSATGRRANCASTASGGRTASIRCRWTTRSGGWLRSSRRRAVDGCDRLRRCALEPACGGRREHVADEVPVKRHELSRQRTADEAEAPVAPADGAGGGRSELKPAAVPEQRPREHLERVSVHAPHQARGGAALVEHAQRLVDHAGTQKTEPGIHREDVERV